MEVFDLNKRCPQIVFVGNGLVYNKDNTWKEFIKKVSRDDADIEKYKDENGNFTVSNTILTFAVTAHDDKVRREKYSKVLNMIPYNPNKYIDELLTLPLDAFLTTNYTYEIENAMMAGYSAFNDRKKRKYSDCTKGEIGNKKQRDAKFLIHTYNKFGDFPPVWHIHGEARRNTSLVLSHDEYGRLVNEILKFNSDRSDNYYKHSDELKMKSWIDYFLTGDVYILGCGFDFAEFDLWWLLNRRLREKCKDKIGKVYFYEPISSKNKYKHMVLSDVEVEVKNFGIEICDDDTNEDISQKFDEFYLKAIEDIRKNIKHNS